MQKKVLIPLAPGFEEIETITVVDILRRSGAKVFLAGIYPEIVEGSRGVCIHPDCLLEEVTENDFDLLALPGGKNSTEHLQKDSRVIKFIQTMNHHKKYIGAICAAPIILQTAGILIEQKITSHPSVKHLLLTGQYLEDIVVVDGNIITSQGPGTAMDFALKLVELLFNEDRVKTLKKAIMAKP